VVECMRWLEVVFSNDTMNCYSRVLSVELSTFSNMDGAVIMVVSTLVVSTGMYAYLVVKSGLRRRRRI